MFGGLVWGELALTVLRSPVTRWLAAGTIVVLLALGWHNSRVDAAVAAATTAERTKLLETFKRQTEAELRRQQTAHDQAVADAQDRAAAAESALAEQKEEADAIIHELRSRPGACRLPPDLLRRLRGLQG